LAFRLFSPIADVHAISLRSFAASDGVGEASTARTDVDASVCDGPTAFVTVVRIIEAEVGTSTALGATVIVTSEVFDWTDMLLKFAVYRGCSVRRRRRHEYHEVFKGGEVPWKDSSMPA